MISGILPKIIENFIDDNIMYSQMCYRREQEPSHEIAMRISNDVFVPLRRHCHL
jgi:hypothetical protein